MMKSRGCLRGRSQAATVHSAFHPEQNQGNSGIQGSRLRGEACGPLTPPPQPPAPPGTAMCPSARRDLSTQTEVSYVHWMLAICWRGENYFTVLALGCSRGTGNNQGGVGDFLLGGCHVVQGAPGKQCRWSVHEWRSQIMRTNHWISTSIATLIRRQH